MNVLLIPGNTDLNRGDQALVWESINVIKEVYDHPDITLVRDNDKRQYAQTEKLGYKSVLGILKHPARIIKKSNGHIRYSALDLFLVGSMAIIDLILTSCLLVPVKFVNQIALLFMKDRKESFQAFKQCDAIFVKGGGFIHSYGSVIDPYQMYFLLFSILLGIRFKKDIYVLPNSIGPLKNRIAAFIADYALNHCKYVSVRESVSEGFLKKRKQTKVPIYRHADLGYFLTKSDIDAKQYLQGKGVRDDKPKVVVTLRPYRFPGSDSPEELYSHYINAFSSFCGALHAKGFQVILFAHTLGPSSHENDTLAIGRVAKELDRSGIPYVYIDDDSLTCRDVMAIYSCADYLIGTRFHSVIFAQNSCVPTIAISYGGNKGVGIMSDLGLDEYSIPMDEVSINKLSKTFDSMVKADDEYRAKLKGFRTRLMDDRAEMVSEIRRLSSNKK